MRSEPKFYLKDNKASVSTPILLNLKIHKKIFRYSTQKSIIPELWDKTTQRPTKNKEILKEYRKFIPTLKKDLKDIENRLINMDRDVREYFSNKEFTSDIIDFSELRFFLDQRYKVVANAVPDKKEVELNEYIESFLEGISNGSILVNSGVNYGKKYEASTIKTWREWYTQIKLFQKYYGILKWESVNKDVYDEILHFYYEKDYRVNTVGKIIKNLKAILKRSYEDGLHKNEIFRSADFKVLKEDIDKVTLTTEEVERVYNLDLSKEKALDFHRDILLIGCFSALRISDISRLNKSHIKKSGDRIFLHLRMKKTTGEIIVPVNSKLEELLQKYDYQVPRININNLRRDIKIICKLAEIIEPVEIKSSKGGKILYETKPKYEFVSAHTGRRTGATLMFLSGIDTLLLRKITGHKKENTLLGYINVSQEKIMELLANNSFFK